PSTPAAPVLIASFECPSQPSESEVLRRPVELKPGIPCATVLTVSFALSLGTGLYCSHHRRNVSPI
ncbi:MAG TPA: hypothetical protein VMM15_24560, partial [Bradyrhizobium sp.]|nr:hypothetical protein [Bradyrhizobium sp.]